MTISGFALFLMLGMVACGGETEVADDGVVEDAWVADDLENDTGVSTWDSEAFNTRFASTDYYEGWDANDDNFLDENEYRRGFYDTWDVNDDEALDENEWTMAAKDWRLENQSWTDWDTSGDGVLDENEYNAGFDTIVWYGEWDQDDDNQLSEREYTDGVFRLWDANNDEVLDDTEYRVYSVYYAS
ncbi:hypothetical protein [Pontibacter ummariensis]|nr:hypothetical protein [Pontibacter ummariensis]